MTDPIQVRGPVPAPATNGPPAEPPRVSAQTAAAVLDTLETSAPSGPWVPDATQAALDEPVAEQPRELAPETQAKLDAFVGGIFVRRPAAAAYPPARPAPVFDPATASRNGDGSLVPPAGRPVPGAPAPGRGPVSPPGLDRGNSVFRYAPDGTPSNFSILDQRDTNGCGTTSLAMFLNFLAGGKQVFDRPDVDAAIRHYDLFTSPGEIAAFARRRGLDATIASGATPADLRRMVDQGLPTQVLLDVSEAHDGSGLHFELITGYGTGPDGKPYFELANPWGMREYMSEEALMYRWSSLSAKGFPLGIDRVAITMKPKGSAATLLADDQGAWLDAGMTSLRVARGLTQVTSGWARKDPATTTAGAIRLVAGGLLAIPALVGHAGRLAATRYMNEGLAELRQPGGFWRGLGKTVAGGLGAAVAAVPEAIGNVGNRLVDFVAGGAYAAVRSAGNWWSRR